MNDRVKAATEETRQLTNDELRERIIRLGFGGDRERFESFVQALREALPDDVTVILRGSAVIGVRWEDGAPFDADGPGTSDLDLTLVGGDMLKLWRDDAFYIPKLHTVPLSEDAPDVCPVLVPLRRALCTIAGRPVNIQATSSIVQYARDVLMDQPYFTILEKGDERAAADDESERRGQPAPGLDAGAEPGRA
jgi:hypothetical protein